jgi:membrane protein required for colicin V production
MNSSQVVDLLVVGVLLYCTIRGASRGLLSQLAWVVALLLCFKFAGTLSPALEPFIAVDPPLRQWLAMLAVYVGLCGAAFLAAGMASSWMEKTKILDFDRHLGGLLGLAKGVVICLTAMYFLITMSPSIRNIVGQTYSGYGAAVILSHSQVLLKLVPEHAVPMVQHVIDRFNQHLKLADDDLAGAKPADPSSFPGLNPEAGQPESWLNGSADFRLEDMLSSSSQAPRDDSGTRMRTDEPGSGTRLALNDILALLPERVRDSLPQATLNAIQDAAPEEQRRLLSQLRQAVPSGMSQVLSDFLRGSARSDSDTPDPAPASARPAGSPSAAAGPARLTAADAALLREISGIYSQRSDIELRAREYLAGVPPAVIQRVLADWHADALGLPRDPDSGTDVNSRLDERILRQLNRAGIPLQDLDATLRSRLTQL